MAEYAIYLENADNIVTAEQHRVMTTTALMGRDGTKDTGTALGTKPAPDFVIQIVQRQIGANMSVDVLPGIVYISPNTGDRNGTYTWANNETDNVVLDAADTSNPRIDVVGVIAYDTAYGDPQDYVGLVVIKGTAAASPVVPSFPNNFTPLARIFVSANTTVILQANIAEYRYPSNQSFAAGGWRRMGNDSGGVIPRTYPSNPTPGQVVVDMVTGWVKYWSPYQNNWQLLTTTGKLSTYTPVLTASSVNPTLGSGGVASGAYRYLTPNLVWVKVYIKFGSGSADPGSGFYTVSLPTPTVANPVANGGCFTGYTSDSSAGDTGLIKPTYLNTNKVAFQFWDPVTASGNAVGASAPFVWALNDTLQFQGIYEV